jgi:hypothetical protein
MFFAMFRYVGRRMVVKILALFVAACTQTMPPIADTASLTSSERVVLAVRQFVEEGDIWNSQSLLFGRAGMQGALYININDGRTCISKDDVTMIMGVQKFEIIEAGAPIIREYAPGYGADTRARRPWFQHGQIVYDGIGPHEMIVGFFFEEFYCVQLIDIHQKRQ